MRKRGFTLIELLTVISIIVILMAILLPAINGVKHRARAAVCLSNLRQWGMVYKMYTDEFDGKLPRDYGEFPWYYPIRNYYSDEHKILLCPMAKKPANSDDIAEPPFGGTFRAWGYFTPSGERQPWDRIGSYGLNKWAYKLAEPQVPAGQQEQEQTESSESSSPKFKFIRPSPPDIENGQDKPYEIIEKNRYWNTAYETNSNNIPLITDSVWLFTSLHEYTSPSVSYEFIKYFSYSAASCIDRHNGGINAMFMDFSVRKVGLKELWTLKWHKQFDTAGQWTQAGGVLPEDWPKWMRGLKDY